MTYSQQQPQRNGSQFALWRQQQTSAKSPVARGTIRLSIPMLRELMARAQAQAFSGNDDRTGPYIELRWSGFQVASQNEKAPALSGPIETPGETEAREAAARQAAGGGGGWGAPPAAAPAQQWGAPPPAGHPAAAPPAPAAAPQWGAHPPAAAPAAAPQWGAPPPPDPAQQWGAPPAGATAAPPF